MTDETADLRELLRANAKERAELEARVQQLERERDEDIARQVNEFWKSSACCADAQHERDAACRDLAEAVQLLREYENTTRTAGDLEDRNHAFLARLSTAKCAHEWEPNTDLSGWRCEKCGKPRPEPTIHAPLDVDKANEAIKAAFGVPLPPLPIPWGKK